MRTVVSPVWCRFLKFCYQCVPMFKLYCSVRCFCFYFICILCYFRFVFFFVRMIVASLILRYLFNSVELHYCITLFVFVNKDVLWEQLHKVNVIWRFYPFKINNKINVRSTMQVCLPMSVCVSLVDLNLLLYYEFCYGILKAFRRRLPSFQKASHEFLCHLMVSNSTKHRQ